VIQISGKHGGSLRQAPGLLKGNQAQRVKPGAPFDRYVMVELQVCGVLQEKQSPPPRMLRCDLSNSPNIYWIRILIDF
jgi:hypothetical protein